MCVVSMILDHGRAYPPEHWTHQATRDYLELIRKAKAYDEMTKQPDCEDPDKVQLLKDILERLKKLEAK